MWFELLKNMFKSGFCDFAIKEFSQVLTNKFSPIRTNFMTSENYFRILESFRQNWEFWTISQKLAWVSKWFGHSKSFGLAVLYKIYVETCQNGFQFSEKNK